MIGDRMDTDVIAGLEAGLHTILVLSGVTTRGELDRFPYVPNQVVSGVGDLVVGRRDTDDRSSRLRTGLPQPDER